MLINPCVLTQLQRKYVVQSAGSNMGWGISMVEVGLAQQTLLYAPLENKISRGAYKGSAAPD